MTGDRLQSLAELREIMEGKTAQAADAMLLLRPRWKTADAVIDFIDTKLRPTGYRLVGAFKDSSGTAVSVVRFSRAVVECIGHYMYIDDVSTLETARGNGFADELIRWVIADAKRRQCEGVHLDSALAAIGQRHIGCTCELPADLSPSLLARSRQPDEDPGWHC